MVIKNIIRKGAFKINSKRLIYLVSILLLFMLILFIKADSSQIPQELNREVKMQDNAGGEGPVISHAGGFYSEDIAIEALCKKAGDIYYTTDGSLPEKENSYRYEKPISIKAENAEHIYTYKFKAFFEDGMESEVVTNTYFMGNSIGERYDTLILSISADNDALYGYENGIFIEGKLRDEWKAAHPEEEPAFDTPANYNVRGKESERPVFIEIFEQDGTRIISQNGGIRVSGNFTRQSEQKSFKIYARKEYDEQNKFRYVFFDDNWSEEGNSLIRDYGSLKIRNSGNDRSEGFIRDELGLTLASQAGFDNTQSIRPASVYINGVYKGFYWMHSEYDEEYFEEKYGKYNGEMVVIGKGETNMAADTENETENKCASEYMEIYNKYSVMDLTDDNACKELNSFIDIENYLRYYALEIYMANRDWPYNNLQAYRFVAADGDYKEDSVFDGRYRYLLFDVDTTMGLGSVRDSLNAAQSYETLTLIEERNLAPLFTALLKRADCQNYFASYICDLANGAFSTENVYAVLDELHAKRINEMRAYIKESEKDEELPDISEQYLDMQMDCIKAWAEVTPVNLIENIGKLWQLGNMYSLYMTLPEGTGAEINGMAVENSEYTGTYLSGCKTVVTASVPEGREFAYWEINGEVFMEEEITLDAGMILDGSIYMAMYTEDGNGGLSVTEIKAEGKSDYIMLTNTSNEEINTWGYYLMDKDKVSHMNYLEGIILKPEESIIIGCKNYDNESPGVKPFMNVNFNLKKGEKVILGHSNGGTVEEINIPDLNMTDGVYRKNRISEEWWEVSIKE